MVIEEINGGKIFKIIDIVPLNTAINIIGMFVNGDDDEFEIEDIRLRKGVEEGFKFEILLCGVWCLIADKKVIELLKELEGA